MMRALLVALALAFAAGALPASAMLDPGGPRAPAARLAPVSAAIVIFRPRLAAQATAAKRCGSRGGYRRTRSTYTTKCT